MEIWKQLEENNNYYISSYGRVYSKLSKKILKTGQDCNGYCRFSIRINGKKKTIKVHRLVAKYFIKNIDNKKEINHIDGNKSNNNVNNLEWCTREENEQHKRKILKKCVGEKHGRAKLTKEQAIYIKQSNETQVALAKKFNVSRYAIQAIKYNETWREI